MQLKMRRFEKEGGFIFKHVIYCVDVRLEVTPEELRLLKKHRMMNAHVYNPIDDAPSEEIATKRLPDVASQWSWWWRAEVTTRRLLNGYIIASKHQAIVREAEAHIVQACERMRALFKGDALGEQEVVMKDGDFD